MPHFTDLPGFLDFLRSCKGMRKPEKMKLFKRVTLAEDIRKDRDAALQSVEVTGNALVFFDDDTRNTFDIVLAAAKKNISALGNAGDDIRSDPNDGQCFLQQLGSGAFSYLLKGATGDLRLCWYCFVDLNDCHQLESAPVTVRKNEVFALKLLGIKGKGWVLDLFHESLWDNIDLLVLAFSTPSLIYARRAATYVESNPELFGALLERCPVALQAFPNAWNLLHYVVPALNKGMRVVPAHPILAVHFPGDMRVLESAVIASPECMVLAKDVNDAFYKRVIVRNAECAKYLPDRLLNEFKFIGYAACENWKLFSFLKREFIKPKLCVRLMAQEGAGKYFSEKHPMLQLRTLRFAMERVESYKVQLLILCAAKPVIRIDETSWTVVESDCTLQMLHRHGRHFASIFMQKISKYAGLAGLKEYKFSGLASRLIRAAASHKRKRSIEEQEREVFSKFGL